MAGIALRIFVALGLPVAIFVGGAWIMSLVSGRHRIQQLLNNADTADQKPLNQRFGYCVDEVDRHWGAFAHDSGALNSEMRLLEMDLVFPFLYGAALATSLLVVRALLGRPFNAVWVMLPVVITLLADWTENLVLMFQLQRFAEDGFAGLNEGWIKIASAATILKLLFFIASSLLVVAIIIAVLSSRLRRRTGRSKSQAGAV